MTIEDKINEYFNQIDIETPYINRACEVVKQAGILYGFSDDATIFVSDHLDGTKNRVPENLWILDKENMYEMKKFSSKDGSNIDKMPISGSIREEFNWSGNSLTSFEKHDTMRLQISYPDNLSATFFASDKNCNHLIDLYNKYFR